MWIIDRFEEDKAVIECDDILFNIPRSVLPSDANEGDVISIIVDKIQTQKRKEKIADIMKRLSGK